MLMSDIFLTLLVVVFALMVVFSERTVVAAFSLLMCLLMMAMIYFQLGSVFLAAVQVLVNAGAIAILFVFVMMLINLENLPIKKLKHKLKLVALSIAVLVILGVLLMLVNNNMESISTINLADNSMNAMFDRLFNVDYLAFELATVLLLAAIVATVMVTSHPQNLVETKKE